MAELSIAAKGTLRFVEDGASDSAMGEYCRSLAAAGYACFSIEYRLVPEDPALPSGLDPAMLMPKAMLKDPVMTGRIDVVRGRMGLPPLDDLSREQLWNAFFAASEDLVSAVAFVRTNAEGSSIERSTWVSAAKFKTAPGRCSRKIARTASPSAMASAASSGRGEDVVETRGEDENYLRGDFLGRPCPRSLSASAS